MAKLTPQIHIIAGDTSDMQPAFMRIAGVQAAPTGYKLAQLCKRMIPKMDTHLHLTKTAIPGFSTQAAKAKENAKLSTNADVCKLLDKLTKDPRTKMIFMPCSKGQFSYLPGGEGNGVMIRHQRKDITLIGLENNCDGKNLMYKSGLNTLKANSANLVFSYNHNGFSMVIVPEETAYFVGVNLLETMKGLIYTARERSQLTFTHSTVIAGNPVKWSSPLVPEALRTVVNYCIKRKAYKPFRNVTAGHFAVKVNPTTFLTSRRKTNFNNLSRLGLVKVETDGPDTVLAYGSKPSVGGQSQRIVFGDHPGLDCIVHFHCPKRLHSKVPTVSQLEIECGSHQCGKNTSKGLREFGNLKAVFLENHGPNIVFSRHINPAEVIQFIEDNFILEGKTGGLVD